MTCKNSLSSSYSRAIWSLLVLLRRQTKYIFRSFIFHARLSIHIDRTQSFIHKNRVINEAHFSRYWVTSASRGRISISQRRILLLYYQELLISNEWIYTTFNADLLILNLSPTHYRNTIKQNFNTRFLRRYLAKDYPDSKVHGAKMGSTWVLSATDGPHVGPMNLAIRVICCLDAGGPAHHTNSDDI